MKNISLSQSHLLQKEAVGPVLILTWASWHIMLQLGMKRVGPSVSTEVLVLIIHPISQIGWNRCNLSLSRVLVCSQNAGDQSDNCRTSVVH